jgi:hypothetical protein
MDPSACRVIYIDERFNTERWISREGLSPTTPARAGSQVEFSDLPPDLQTNVNAFLTVFNQGGYYSSLDQVANAANIGALSVRV